MIEQVHRKVIEGKRWEEAPHQIPACVDCHSPHKKPRQYQTTREDCLLCHADPDRVAASLLVDREAYDASTHAKVECAQCHSQVDPSRERACETVTRKVDCAACHEDQVARYQISTHGTLHASGDSDAPACLDCHSKHATQSRKDPISPTYPRNIPNLCARCHRAGEKAAKRIKATWRTSCRPIVTASTARG